MPSIGALYEKNYDLSVAVRQDGWLEEEGSRRRQLGAGRKGTVRVDQATDHHCQCVDSLSPPSLSVRVFG